MKLFKFGVKILTIKEESYNFKNVESQLIEEFDTNKLFVGLGLSFGIDYIDEKVRVSPKIVYKYEFDGYETEILNTSYSFEYSINSFKNNVTKGDGKFNMNPELMETIVGESVAAMRGIIAIKTLGSFINNYPLPIFDTSVLTEQFNSTVKGASPSIATTSSLKNTRRHKK